MAGPSDFHRVIVWSPGFYCWYSVSVDTGIGGGRFDHFAAASG